MGVLFLRKEGEVHSGEQPAISATVPNICRISPRPHLNSHPLLQEDSPTSLLVLCPLQQVQDLWGWNFLRAGRGSLRSGSLLVKTDMFSALSCGGEMGTMECPERGEEGLPALGVGRFPGHALWPGVLGVMALPSGRVLTVIHSDVHQRASDTHSL